MVWARQEAWTRKGVPVVVPDTYPSYEYPPSSQLFLFIVLQDSEDSAARLREFRGIVVRSC
eukprot:scaffold1616_cov310-Pinguiococcus_pyrenoidosus.AAC.43